MAKNKVTVVLEVDDKGTAKIKQFGGQAKKTMRETAETSKSTGDSISKHWLAIGAAVGAALYGLQRASRVFIEASNKQAKAVATMETVMRSMGRYSSTYSADLQKLAGSLQDVTNFGDEVTIQGTKFLMTYGAITDDLMPRSIKAMQDLATLTGGGEGSVVNAANMLGKASMGMVGQLRRVGITVDATLFKKRGYLGMLEALEKQVGGLSEAERTATIGYEAVGNEIGDLQENIGELIKLGLGDFFEDSASGLSSFNERMRENLQLARERKELGEPEMIFGAEFAGVAGGVFEGPSEGRAKKMEAEGAAFGFTISPEDLKTAREETAAAAREAAIAANERTDAELEAIRQKTAEVWGGIETQQMEAQLATVALAHEISEEKKQILIDEDAAHVVAIEERMRREIEASNTEIAIEKKKQQDKERLAKMESYARRQAMSATMTDMQTIAQVWGSHNKALFEAFKAFSIAQTIIDTYEGAQASYTALAGIPIIGPALGAAAAAAAIIAGFARVEAIRKTKPAKAARGGIFDEPTLVEAGEAGPEAFVPLPGVGRNIPVEFTGGRGPGGDVYHVTIQALDAASFDEMVTRNPSGVVTVVKDLVISGDREFVQSLREVTVG